MQLTDADYEDIRAKAEAANEGEWYSEVRLLGWGICAARRKVDPAYMVRMDPPTTIALCDEIERMRRLLWLRHGCPVTALYGDDGEMQCNACIIDFKRLTADQIDVAFVHAAEAARKEADLGNV